MNTRVFLIVAILVFALSLLCVFVDGPRRYVQSLFKPENKVLSVVTGEYYPASPIDKVVKSRTEMGIMISVYTREGGDERLLEEILIGDPHDAYYELNQRPTNLALNDMNGDGIPEIIAPTYDLGWQPRLNVFRFNLENQAFEPY